jgi:hypothetical protein
LRLARILERPSETAMAHVVLLRCALKGSGNDAARHEEALRQTNPAKLAAHVRHAMEGVTHGTRAGGTEI